MTAALASAVEDARFLAKRSNHPKVLKVANALIEVSEALAEFGRHGNLALYGNDPDRAIAYSRAAENVRRLAVGLKIKVLV